MVRHLLRRRKYLRSGARHWETEETLKQSDFIRTTDEQGINAGTIQLLMTKRIIKRINRKETVVRSDTGTKLETRQKIGRTERMFTTTDKYDDSVRNLVNSTLHGMETDQNRNRAGWKTDYSKQLAFTNIRIQN